MSKCFSLTASRTRCYVFAFSNSGLRLTVADLGDGTVMQCWVPKTRREDKPSLVLIHGFGANAMWQWADVVRAVAPHFNVYVPDLVFFGGSYTTRPDRSDAFQARCVMGVLLANRVGKMVVAGMSYGGFVAYSMAAQWPEAVERVVLCCAGVCLEERDLAEGLFRVADVEEAARILLPRTAAEMRELMRYTLVKPPLIIPSCFLQDYVDEMFSENVEEKKELLRAIPKGRKLLDLPKIPQPTLIIWGDLDRVFPLELGYRLKSHLGENAELVVIKNAGHAFNVEKPKELDKHLKPFLFSATLPLPNTSSLASNHQKQ
ncbi:uncharacterized protein LOC127807852 [Diospyros lotus]|uniref:uncharacterized protein LOC127807852 n=1 Tax=Diospyros lotus TaxID=55363 RepID=UPI0022587ECB|nr:uncharacterized protein LOC127807852 [Diospyros lotus]